MRKIILLSVLLICSIGVCFGQLASKVDERIELTGVVFRLAGIPEYKEGLINEYNDDIDHYFSDFKHDPLIEYVIKLRNENRLGYGSIAASAAFFNIDKGKIILNSDFPLSKLKDLGNGWKDEATFKKYIKLLNNFYRKTKFRAFYDTHKPLYEQTEAGLNALLVYFNSEWIPEFYGVEFKAPEVYVALGNGRSNYCIVDYEHEAGYAIVIGGRTQYDLGGILPIIIHEICHNYSDPLFERHWPQMVSAAKSIYNRDIQEEMWKNAYGEVTTTMLEWLNNLCTIMYFRDNLPPLAPYFAGEMRDRGFIWLPRSVQFMENFYQNRDRYPHFDSFMPQIVELLNNTAEDFDRVKFEYETRRPYVVSIFPANGSNILDGNFSEVRVTFSQPMAIDCYSIGVIEGDSSISKIPRSETIDAYWPDNHTIAIPIEPSQIEKNKKYGLVLENNVFVTRDYNKMESDYTIIYHTQE